MNVYSINILPVKLLKEEVDIYFSLEKKCEYDRIYKNNLPINFPNELKEQIEKFAWWSPTPGQGDITITVDLKRNERFAKHYFNKIIYQHFKEKGLLINKNFINDTEIYIEDYSHEDNDTRKYLRFSLKFDRNYFIKGTSLLLSYEGESFVLKNNIASLNINEDILGRVIFENKVTKYCLLSDQDKEEQEILFPVLNLSIRSALRLQNARKYSSNKYKYYFEQISMFYQEYLKDVVVCEVIKILSSGFYKLNSGEINHTSNDSNLLLFGNNTKNFIPYIGIKENGPIKGIDNEELTKFFFIFHENDKDYANKLYSYLKKGYKSFPGLKSFVDLDFEIDQEKTIRFSNRNPLPEIEDALKRYNFNESNKYAAIYISQIKREGEDEEEDKIYFKLKELLVEKSIPSQVIYKENISNPAFNFFLPNIAIALLAKLGGIPWRLYRPIQNDLIIGIGAKWTPNGQNHYIGSAFCFKNDGSFRGFNVFEKNNTSELSRSIKNAIEQYTSENSSCDRLVIHYYKEMNWEEEEPIRAALRQLNLNIPYFVLTIKETQSKDYVLFDTSFDGLMPKSGTFVKLKKDQYLLCNNTRYSLNTKTRIEGFPFPIKISIKSYNYEKYEDDLVIKDLIDQVYQFSRMYWKSVRQRNLPVTIEYSKIIAGIVANFENKELVSFAKNSLWFL